MTNQNRPPILARIIPYLVLGIALVFMFIAFIFLSSILLIGAIVGLIIFAVTYVKTRFFGSKNQGLTSYQAPRPPPQQQQKAEGEVYEHDESNKK